MISTQLLCFRPVDEQHLDAWRAWVNDPEIAGYLDRVLPVTKDEHLAFYRKAVVENRDAVWFALHDRESDRHVGLIWLWDIDRRHARAEVRIMIGDRDYWNRGFGSDAIGAVSRFAFDSLHLHKLYAYVMERNPRAHTTFHKAGFNLEATLVAENFWHGRFHDVWRMALHGPPA